MKKTVFILIISFFSYSLFSYGQTTIKDTNFSIYKKIPQEKVFVHFNTSFLLTGDYLYYKIYCLNTKNDNLSTFSKIAYVELIGTNKIPIFRHKIKLMSGLGQGDVFIPKSIPSGNYKLIAYTQWMRNVDKNYFFQNDISIINPFQQNQKAILRTNDSTVIRQITINKEKIDNKSIIASSNNYIELKLASHFFSNREKVSLKINSLKDNASYGNYSISVRKNDTIQIPNRLTTNTYMSLYLRKLKSSIKNNSIYLPELRGELLIGKVFFKGTQKPAANVKIALSISGKEYLFKIANTNDSGTFYINLEREYESTNATVQVISDNRENFEIILNQQTPLDYNNLSFNNFRITPKSRGLITERSIYNQIENAYISVKSDSINSIEPLIPFYDAKKYIEYTLDDYTRFSTIKETIVEVIDFVTIRRTKEGDTFHVISYNPNTESNLLPLVIVDGLLIQNHKELIDYDARKVKKVSVVRDKYIYGSHIFEGVVSIETIDGNYKSTQTGDYIKNIELFKPLITKSYFNQIYNNSKKSERIPDFRNQLLWKPNFRVDKKEMIITFFTSDNNGDYEICLEGFTNEGKSISLREIITVK